MKPCEVITYRGKPVVIVDISNTNPEESIAYFPQAQRIIAGFPEKSALVLTDATNARYSIESANALKEFAARNTPYVKASATVGVEGMKEILRKSVEQINIRTINSFKTRLEAMEWLISQE